MHLSWTTTLSEGGEDLHFSLFTIHAPLLRIISNMISCKAIEIHEDYVHLRVDNKTMLVLGGVQYSLVVDGVSPITELF